MRVVLASILILFSVVSASADNALKGVVDDGNVSDGDTFSYDIRLWGVDTPETKQRCYKEGRGCYRCGLDAKKALRNKIGDKRVRCEHAGATTYGRNVAVCFLGDLEINLWLIKQGLGVAYRRYLNRFPNRKTAYIEAEKQAKQSRKGIWSGDFIMPSKWRSGERLAQCRGQ